MQPADDHVGPRFGYYSGSRPAPSRLHDPAHGLPAFRHRVEHAILNQCFYTAARDGNDASITSNRNTEGLDENKVAPGGFTPLKAAACNGHTQAVRALLCSQSIDANKAMKRGMTPLHSAAQRGQVGVVGVLLEKSDVDCNKVNEHGGTPLLVAAFEGHSDIVQVLLEKPDINCNATRAEAPTPLHAAACRSHADIVTALLSCPNVDLDAAFRGQTPLDGAINEGHPHVASLLRAAVIKRQSDPNNRINDCRKTRLMDAIARGDHDCTVGLLEHASLDPTLTDAQGRTALYYAAREDQRDAARVLLSHGQIDPNSMTDYGATALHIAARKNNLHVVNALLEHPATDVNIPLDQSGATPLYIAAKRGHTGIVRALSTDPRIHGFTPISRPPMAPLHSGLPRPMAMQRACASWQIIRACGSIAPTRDKLPQQLLRPKEMTRSSPPCLQPMKSARLLQSRMVRGYRSTAYRSISPRSPPPRTAERQSPSCVMTRPGSGTCANSAPTFAPIPSMLKPTCNLKKSTRGTSIFSSRNW